MHKGENYGLKQSKKTPAVGPFAVTTFWLVYPPGLNRYPAGTTPYVDQLFNQLVVTCRPHLL
jgi:hypothetical protein